MCTSNERISRSVDNVRTKYESVHITRPQLYYIHSYCYIIRPRTSYWGISVFENTEIHIIRRTFRGSFCFSHYKHNIIGTYNTIIIRILIQNWRILYFLIYEF